jgi:hypothetical protein
MLAERHVILLFRSCLLLFWALKSIKSLILGVAIKCQRGLLACVVDLGYLEITLASDFEVHPTLLLGVQLGVLHQQGRIPH